MPIIEFLVEWLILAILRALDRRFTLNEYSTKQKSIQLYIDIYSGPEFRIHYRMSYILNTTFVCLLFGTALPVLYPIGLAAFMMLYLVERL
jgi:hypothetical protein